MHDWQAVVAQHGPLVWQTAYRLLGNHADAADCFQETFLAALEVSRRQDVRNLPGLLTRLATTRAIDTLRRRTRENRGRIAEKDGERIADGADPLGGIEVRELARQLRQAIAQLPEQEAKVFCLRYLSEMSYRQIARELRIGVNVVGVSLHRAKARLRQALAQADAKNNEVSHEKR